MLIGPTRKQAFLGQTKGTSCKRESTSLFDVDTRFNLTHPAFWFIRLRLRKRTDIVFPICGSAVTSVPTGCNNQILQDFTEVIRQPTPAGALIEGIHVALPKRREDPMRQGCLKRIGSPDCDRQPP